MLRHYILAPVHWRRPQPQLEPQTSASDSSGQGFKSSGPRAMREEHEGDAQGPYQSVSIRR
ncbi:hypothetical protein E2C01_094871 [Portunus trituberculatus]|uniref:Uncharacterized protein n=1 Tax=Portunus trituberculatus TaxID=210409 RepID=A0A5B7K220_PORTR|nr:hypothetical protein [Portunus trituberculatus]